MRVYFDSSAFAKRYVQEQGTAAVLQWCERATEICLSGIALAEIVSAFCRLRREGRISDADYRHLKSVLLLDIEDVAIGDLAPAVLAHAVASLEAGPLRAMDAIHVGTAVALEADVFVSADRRQQEAASRAGLRVEPV